MNENYNEIMKDLKKCAETYEGDQYQLYNAEYGWHDWMYDYIDRGVSDVEILTEDDLCRVNEMMREAFDDVHDKNDPKQIALRIRNSTEWIKEDCEALCDKAGLLEDFKEAFYEGDFSSVVKAAAEKLGVNIK